MSLAPSSISGSEKLEETSSLLRAIGSGSKPRLMNRLKEVSSDHHRELSAILDKIPSVVVAPIVEMVIALTDPTSGLSGCQEIHRVSRHLGLDPRSYREASRTLSVLSDLVKTNRNLDLLVFQGIQILETKGVLGLSGVDKVARFLISVDRRSGNMQRVGPELIVTDDRHHLEDWQRMAKESYFHDPLWGPRAASLVLYPSIHKSKGVEATRYGSSIVSDRKLPILKDILPEETLVVDEPMMVMLSSKHVERGMVRVDPIPKALIEGIGQSELYARASQYFDIDIKLEEPRLLATMQVVYISIRAFVSIVQSRWVHQMKGVRIRVSDDSTRNFSFYHPKTKTIWITSAPLSAWALLHELSHALDDELWDPIGFASCNDGNPLASITSILLPYYASMAKERSQAVWRTMFNGVFPQEMREELSKGPVRLDEVISSLDVSEERKRASFKIVVQGGDLRKPHNRERARNRLNMRSARGELLVLSSIQDAIVDTGDGKLSVDLKLLRDSFLEHEELQVLAPPEIFARFFSQYARTYWSQSGWAFGVSGLPGDLDPTILASLVPTFNDALLRSQLIDQTQLTIWTAKEENKSRLFAASLVALGFIISEGILPG